MEEANEYRMSFSTGGLFLNESVEVARMHRARGSWEQTLTRAVEEGQTRLPKEASNRRTLREIVNRVSTLSDEERVFLIEDADRTDQQALLWLACCRAYRFMREFALEVIRERYLSYQLDLPLETFDTFFEAKAEWNEGLANLSKSTRMKLRQIMFRMMREAAVISDEDKIQTAYFSPRLKALIQENNRKELLYFPGLALGD